MRAQRLIQMASVVTIGLGGLVLGVEEAPARTASTAECTMYEIREYEDGAVCTTVYFPDYPPTETKCEPCPDCTGKEELKKTCWN